MLEKQLEALGFSAEEVKTYIRVLEAGSVTVGALAKKVVCPGQHFITSLNAFKKEGLLARR